MLTKRMILLFFRDKMNVFFSLLATLIIIMLYVLFLGNMIRQTLESAMGFSSDLIGLAAASVMLSGMIAVTSTSACMGALGVAVADRQDAGKDFHTSPLARWKISLGYITGAGIVGLLMTLIALVLVTAYLLTQGGSLPTLTGMGQLFITVILSSLCANSMMYFVIMFIKTENAYSSFVSVTSTLMGFVMGIYIPIGVFPESIQWVSKLFPMSHAAAMFRQVIADSELSRLFEGAPPEHLEEFRILYGVVYDFGGYISNFWFSTFALILYSFIFFTLSVITMRFRKTD